MGPPAQGWSRSECRQRAGARAPAKEPLPSPSGVVLGKIQKRKGPQWFYLLRAHDVAAYYSVRTVESPPRLSSFLHRRPSLSQQSLGGRSPLCRKNWPGSKCSCGSGSGSKNRSCWVPMEYWNIEGSLSPPEARLERNSRCNHRCSHWYMTNRTTVLVGCHRSGFAEYSPGPSFRCKSEDNREGIRRNLD